MPIPIIALGLATLGTGLAFGVSQRRKMKRELDDNNEIDVGTRLRQHDREREAVLDA